VDANFILPAEGANIALSQIPQLDLKGHFEVKEESDGKGKKGRGKRKEGKGVRDGRNPQKYFGEGFLPSCPVPSCPPRNKFLVRPWYV